MARPLYKTTVVIWSTYPGDTVDLTDLAEDAQSGLSYCAEQTTVKVEDLACDPQWDGTEFFDTEEEL